MYSNETFTNLSNNSLLPPVITCIWTSYLVRKNGISVSNYVYQLSYQFSEKQLPCLKAIKYLASELIFSAIHGMPRFKLQYLILLRTLLHKKKQRGQKPQQGCTRMATTCQCICCIIRKLNLAYCDTPHAMLGTKGFI